MPCFRIVPGDWFCREQPPWRQRKEVLVRRLLSGVALCLVVLVLAACGTSISTLGKIQLHTPLTCPCPAIAPLAQYLLPSANTYFGGIVTGSDGNLWVPEFNTSKIARVT